MFLLIYGLKTEYKMIQINWFVDCSQKMIHLNLKVQGVMIKKTDMMIMSAFNLI